MLLIVSLALMSSDIHFISCAAPDIPIMEATNNNDANMTDSNDAHINNTSDGSVKGESLDLLCFGITLDSIHSDTYLLFYLVFDGTGRGGTKDGDVSEKISGDGGTVRQDFNNNGNVDKKGSDDDSRAVDRGSDGERCRMLLIVSPASVSSNIRFISRVAPDTSKMGGTNNNDINMTDLNDVNINDANGGSPKVESLDLLCFGITLDSFYSDTYLLFYLVFEGRDKGGTEDGYVSEKGSGDDGTVDRGSGWNDAHVDHVDNGSPKGESLDLFSLGITLDSFSSDTHLFASYST
jgi:hypothetical protein